MTAGAKVDIVFVVEDWPGVFEVRHVDHPSDQDKPKVERVEGVVRPGEWRSVVGVVVVQVFQGAREWEPAGTAAMSRLTMWKRRRMPLVSCAPGSS